MFRKSLFAVLLLLSPSAFAQRFGSIKSSDDVSLSSNTILNSSSVESKTVYVTSITATSSFNVGDTTFTVKGSSVGVGVSVPLKPFHIRTSQSGGIMFETTSPGESISMPGFRGPVGDFVYWNPGYDASVGDTLFNGNTQFKWGGTQYEAGEWATTVLDTDINHFTISRGLDLVRAGKTHVQRGKVANFFPMNDMGTMLRVGHGEELQNYNLYDPGTILWGAEVTRTTSDGFSQPIGAKVRGGLYIGAQPQPTGATFRSPEPFMFDYGTYSTGTAGIAISTGATQDKDINDNAIHTPQWIQKWMYDGRIALPLYPEGYLYSEYDGSISTKAVSATASGDSFGSHTATQNVTMSGYGITNSSSYQSTGTLSARWVNGSDNVKTSSITLTRAATPPVIASSDSIRLGGRGNSNTMEIWASSVSIAGTDIVTTTGTQTLTNKTIDANNTAITLPNGTAPTVNATGKIGFDTTDNIVIAHNGTEQFLVAEATQTLCVTILAGSSWDSQTVPVLTAPSDKAITIRSIKSEIIGGTSLAWNMDTRAFGSANSAGSSWFTVSQSASQAGITSLTAQTIAADSTLFWKTSTSAASGTVNAIRLTIRYSENVE